MADAAPDAAPSNQGKSIPEIVNELWELAVAYFQQETIEPLKSAGRFLGFGVPGSILLGIGSSLLMLSGLRALQTETGSTFTGHLSWLPYVIVLAGGLILILLAVLRVSRRKGPNA